MVGSLIEATRGHEDSKLPQIRFIGVGPDPGQIISDVPTTEKLMAEESFTYLFPERREPPPPSLTQFKKRISGMSSMSFLSSNSGFA